MKQFIWSPGYAVDVLIEAEDEETAVRIAIQDRINGGQNPREAHMSFVDRDFFTEVPTQKAANTVPYLGELNFDRPDLTPEF